MACYARWGIPVGWGAQVTSWQRPGEPARQDTDWGRIDPAAPLLTPDVTGDVKAVAAGRVTLTGPPVHADTVVCCAGVGSLSPAGRWTWGITWTHRDPAALTDPGLRAHHLAPYKTMFAGVFYGRDGARARLGSSTAPDLNRARRRAEDMLTEAVRLGVTRTAVGWRPFAGARHHSPHPPVTYQGGVWFMAGLARTGYALAPGYATELTTRIEAAA